MARTVEKVESLIDEDPGMGDALASVKRAADENGGEIQWGDVSDDITSGQWGRFIEKGILVDGDEGFRFADEDAVEEALSDDPTVSTSSTGGADIDVDDDESSWSQADKLAGLASLGMMAGYYYTPIQNVVGETLDVVFSPLSNVMPFYGVLLAAAMVTGLYSTLLQSNLSDMDKMQQYQQKVKDIQERKQEAKERGDDEALDRIQEEQMEAMGDQMNMFKEQFRPMAWIMLLTIPLFLWMYWSVRTGQLSEAQQTVVMPMHGRVKWTEGLLGPMQAWIVWYFLCSMGFSQLIRKALNLQTAPTGGSSDASAS